MQGRSRDDVGNILQEKRGLKPGRSQNLKRRTIAIFDCQMMMMMMMMKMRRRRRTAAIMLKMKMKMKMKMVLKGDLEELRECW